MALHGNGKSVMRNNVASAAYCPTPLSAFVLDKFKPLRMDDPGEDNIGQGRRF